MTLKQGESQQIIVDFSTENVDFLAAGVQKVFARVSNIGNPSLFQDYNNVGDNSVLPQLTVETSTTLGIPFERSHSARLQAGELQIVAIIHKDNASLSEDEIEETQPIEFLTLERYLAKDADTCA